MQLTGIAVLLVTAAITPYISARSACEAYCEGDSGAVGCTCTQEYTSLIYVGMNTRCYDWCVDQCERNERKVDGCSKPGKRCCLPLHRWNLLCRASCNS
ncbi:hypothetical protein AB6A40_005327 [Gnathostoma spinigerum]|uniref:Uncharacterized protein n=1 Tax=Gnathostoma spinigerum TaxID=75299 RepID=A0ABD6EF94_9BILA